MKYTVEIKTTKLSSGVAAFPVEADSIEKVEELLFFYNRQETALILNIDVLIAVFPEQ